MIKANEIEGAAKQAVSKNAKKVFTAWAEAVGLDPCDMVLDDTGAAASFGPLSVVYRPDLEFGVVYPVYGAYRCSFCGKIEDAENYEPLRSLSDIGLFLAKTRGAKYACINCLYTGGRGREGRKQ